MQMMLVTATTVMVVLLCGLAPTSMASPRRHVDPQADFLSGDQSPQLTFMNPDDYQSDDSSRTLQDPLMAAMVETFKVPKRTLSLLSRWKSPQQSGRLYEQLQADRIAPPLKLESWPIEASALRQQRNKLTMTKKEELMALPGLSEAMSMSNRAMPRALRPPGQPLRWG